ncbi:hypothetical protein HZS_7173 [Henneguya salminicola]|nr:hypothetical protein HZS_7173 [Henneguya salminicola]
MIEWKLKFFKVNGYQDSIKLQFDQEDTLPVVIVSTNHVESQIKYDSKHNVIYILTYQKSEDGSIKDSILYSSLLTDSSFTPIVLKRDNRDVMFTKIEAGPEIIVGHSEINDLIAISTNFGKDWAVRYDKLGSVNQILISPINSYHIAIVNNKNEVPAHDSND